MPNRPTSFKKDKEIFDGWRSFLKEDQKKEQDVLNEDLRRPAQETGGRQDISGADIIKKSGFVNPGEAGVLGIETQAGGSSTATAPASTDVAEVPVDTAVETERRRNVQAVGDLNIASQEASLAAGEDFMRSESGVRRGLTDGNIIYQTVEGESIAMNDKAFDRGTGLLPNPITAQSRGWLVRGKDNKLRLTDAGQQVVKARRAELAAKEEAEKQAVALPPGSPLRRTTTAQVRESINQKEIVQEVYNRLIKMIKKGNEK
jgi:hypothetical protein